MVTYYYRDIMENTYKRWIIIRYNYSWPQIIIVYQKTNKQTTVYLGSDIYCIYNYLQVNDVQGHYISIACIKKYDRIYHHV